MLEFVPNFETVSSTACKKVPVSFGMMGTRRAGSKVIVVDTVLILVGGKQIVTPFLTKLFFIELKVFQHTMEDGPVYFIDFDVVKFVNAFQVLPVIKFSGKEV